MLLIAQKIKELFGIHRTPLLNWKIENLLSYGEIPGAGSMDTQIPPAGSLGVLKRRIINSPAPKCINMHFG